MRRYLILSTLCLFSAGISAQGISNIRTFHEEGKVGFAYDLLSIDPSQELYVRLASSNDGGSTFSLFNGSVTGDVNTIVKPGFNKIAAAEDKGEDLTFRLEAISLNNDALVTSVLSRGVVVRIVDVTRHNNDITVTVHVMNKMESNAQESFAFANFNVVDDTGKKCTDLAGDINKMMEIPKGKQRVMSLVIKDASPSARKFSNVEFMLSFVTAKFQSVPITAAAN